MKNIIKGFTLIELLVVITIIGILATGATSVYTSQIQKSRDSVRLTDVKALQGGIEQFYQDDGVYPSKDTADATSFTGVSIYVPKFPKDPKSGQATSSSPFDYLYSESKDGNGILAQEYEISTTFEQAGNVTKKAGVDGGDDANRLELGININDNTNKPTTVSALITSVTLKCVAIAGGGNVACATATPMVIKGN